MAVRNYLVEGLSGTGKSSVYAELVRRGHHAISTDRVWAHHVDPATGLPGGPVRHDTWMWDRERAVTELERSEPDAVELMLDLNRRDQGPQGAIDVDATQPLHQVVDELLRLAT